MNCSLLVTFSWGWLYPAHLSTSSNLEPFICVLSTPSLKMYVPNESVIVLNTKWFIVPLHLGCDLIKTHTGTPHLTHLGHIVRLLEDLHFVFPFGSGCSGQGLCRHVLKATFSSSLSLWLSSLVWDVNVSSKPRACLKTDNYCGPRSWSLKASVMLGNNPEHFPHTLPCCVQHYHVMRVEYACRESWAYACQPVHRPVGTRLPVPLASSLYVCVCWNAMRWYIYVHMPTHTHTHTHTCAFVHVCGGWLYPG